jgi:hypothetical protein
MNWLFELHKTQPVAHAIGVLAFVCVLGMGLGSLKFRGIGLGTAGVLFAGIVPIELLATHTKRLDPACGWWRSVLATTGQPAQFD